MVVEVPPKEPLDKEMGLSEGQAGVISGGFDARGGVSFRDKVLGNESIPMRERVDLMEKKLVNLDLVNGSRLLPMFTVDKNMIEELSQPWKDALIVKRLGKPLGFNAMKAKLASTWKLIGGFDIMDVGNGFFMVTFEQDDDRNKVINEGPWMIYDHYLTVRTWSAEFNSSKATIDRTMVWIRIPSLNLVLYDESLIWTFASVIGKPVKVDLHTLRMAKGRFVRVCVEVDLTQPVVGRVGVQGCWYNVEYEGLHIICAQCGCYGHLLKDCPAKPAAAMAEESGTGAPKQQGAKSENSGQSSGKGTENHGIQDKDHIAEITHGDWVNVVRKKRTNKVPVGPHQKDTRFKDWGNKFNALKNDVLNDEDR